MLRGFSQLSGSGDILRLRSSFVHSLHPGIRTSAGVDLLLHILADLLVRRLAFEAHVVHAFRRRAADLPVFADAELHQLRHLWFLVRRFSLDLEPVHPDRQLGADAVLRFPRIENLPGAQVVVGRAFLAEEDGAVIALRVILGELKGNLDHLRFLDRAADGMRAQRLAVAWIRAELDEALLWCRLLGVAETHANDIVSRRPLVGDEPLKTIIAHVTHADGQIRAGVEMRLFQVMLVIRPGEARAHFGAVAERPGRFVRVVFHGFKAKVLRSGSIFDFGPLAEKKIIVLRRLAKFGNHDGIPGLCGGLFDLGGPFRRTLQRIELLLVVLGDAHIVFLRLDVQLQRLV